MRMIHQASPSAMHPQGKTLVLSALSGCCQQQSPNRWHPDPSLGVNTNPQQVEKKGFNDTVDDIIG